MVTTDEGEMEKTVEVKDIGQQIREAAEKMPWVQALEGNEKSDLSVMVAGALDSFNKKQVAWLRVANLLKIGGDNDIKDGADLPLIEGNRQILAAMMF